VLCSHSLPNTGACGGSCQSDFFSCTLVHGIAPMYVAEGSRDRALGTAEFNPFCEKKRVRRHVNPTRVNTRKTNTKRKFRQSNIQTIKTNSIKQIKQPTQKTCKSKHRPRRVLTNDKDQAPVIITQSRSLSVFQALMRK
jgi:hypothetical protein